MLVTSHACCLQRNVKTHLRGERLVKLAHSTKACLNPVPNQYLHLVQSLVVQHVAAAGPVVVAHVDLASDECILPRDVVPAVTHIVIIHVLIRPVLVGPPVSC